MSLVRALHLLPLALACGALALCAPAARAQINNGVPPELEGIEDVKQNLGAQLPLDLPFVDDLGRDITLRRYFDGKRPVAITLNYFQCASLCNHQLNGLVEALKEMAFTPGDQFEILTISFDPLEGHNLAADKKQAYIYELGKSSAAQGWHFLTGKKADIDALRVAVGFPCRWVPDTNQWAHPATTVLCSPDGRIMRYLGGIYYDPKVLRLSLVEASQGKVGSLWDQVFLTCFHYISSEGRYVPMAMGIMRVGGGLTVAVLLLWLVPVWLHSRRRAARKAAPAGQC